MKTFPKVSLHEELKREGLSDALAESLASLGNLDELLQISALQYLTEHSFEKVFTCYRTLNTYLGLTEMTTLRAESRSQNERMELPARLSLCKTLKRQLIQVALYSLKHQQNNIEDAIPNSLKTLGHELKRLGKDHSLSHLVLIVYRMQRTLVTLK